VCPDGLGRNSVVTFCDLCSNRPKLVSRQAWQKVLTLTRDRMEQCCARTSLTMSPGLRIIRRVSGQGTYVSGHACIEICQESFSAHFSLSISLSLSLSLSLTPFSLSLLGFCHKILDLGRLKPLISNMNLKMWSSKQDLCFHRSIWDKSKNPCLPRFWVDFWRMDPNISNLFTYLVFLKYSSNFQAVGFSLVRNQGKSLNPSFV